MEPKRELTSVDLNALVTELRRYEGATVDKVYLYGDDLLRFKLRDYDRGRVELLVEVGDIKRCHLADPSRVPAAPDRPPEFAKTLRARLAGGALTGVSQHGFDRVLQFEFERPDERTTVVAELFGDGNVAVLDDSGAVLRSLETVRLKSRTVAPGSQYEYPEMRLHPFDLSRDAFIARMDESDTDIVRTLATQLNFGGLYAEELCRRAGVEKTRSIDEASESEYEAVFLEIDRLGEQLTSGDFDPRVYLEDDSVVDVTPFPLEEHATSGLAQEGFDSFNRALDVYFHRLDRGDDTEGGGDPTRPDFQAEIAKRERIIDQQKAAIDEFEQQAERERDRAELLYARYDLVDEVLSTIQDARAEGLSWDEIRATLDEGADRGIPAAEAVVDVTPAEGTVTLDIEGTEVRLDATVGVEKNADRLYQEAKRIEEKKAGALEAIEDTRAELTEWKTRRDAWTSSEDTPADPDDGGDEDTGPSDEDWLARPSIPVRTSEQWYHRFRWFHTSDDFLVIGGRNADQNEELVKKYMERGDRFFHAEAHGGPVTILKATGPSEPTREVDFPASSLDEAAVFAVSYSSVWKDGRGAGDAYAVRPEQVSKTPESGEYLEKGGFVVRGDREYYRDVPAEVAVGIQVEPETRVIGGPPAPVEERTVTSLRLEPGRFAQNDAAVKCYRELKSRFADESFVRKIASADRIQEFLPPGGSEIID